MARNKLLRVISRLWRHDSVWSRWGIRSLNEYITFNVYINALYFAQESL